MTRWPARRCHALVAMMALACSRNDAPAPVPPASSSELRVQGTLTYRARMALPAGTRAVVEVRHGTGESGPVVAEQRIDLKGQQVPIAFELRIDRNRLVVDRQYFMRGALVVDGKPAWVTEPVALDIYQRTLDVGTLNMVPFHAAGFASTLQCGDEHATIGWVADGAELTVGGETFALAQARSASGARYEAVADSSTWIWNKGTVTRVSVRGKEYPPCRVAGIADETFRAHGNEPFWSLEITRATLTFRTPDGSPVALPARDPELTPGARRYTAHGGGHDLAATVADRLCQDDMSGMPYPHAVSVTMDGREYRGCGGEPVALLQGKEWVVEDLNHGGIIDNSRLTLGFSADNRIFGRAGCNTYNGAYTLTGESLTVTNAATTLKACAPSLMQQEERFLKVLADVQRFEIDTTGALVLHTADGRTILARR